MKGVLYKIWSCFLTWLGKLKLLTFGFLPVIAYDPEPFHVTGYDIEKLMKMLKSGDVLLRGYNKYLDGKFIPDEKGYSHAGLYIGNNQVVHAISPCVEKCHMIDFCEADRVMVLRPEDGQTIAIATAIGKIGLPYDFDYKTDKGKLYCFELIATCYPNANVQTHVVKKFLGLIKRKCYLAKSIYENPFFTQIYEKNDKEVDS